MPGCLDALPLWPTTECSPVWKAHDIGSGRVTGPRVAGTRMQSFTGALFQGLPCRDSMTIVEEPNDWEEHS
jgi:hypothetical protein